jgi:hypothetical protein
MHNKREFSADEPDPGEDRDRQIGIGDIKAARYVIDLRVTEKLSCR